MDKLEQDPFETDSKAKQEEKPEESGVRPGEDGIAYWKRISREERQEEKEPERYWSSLEDHGFRRTGDPDYGPIPEPYQSNGLSRAAMFCGFLSIVTLLFGGSVFFAGLGILFALLSRKKKLSRQARLGLMLSSGALAVFIVSLTMVVGTLVSSGSWARIVSRAQQTDLSDPGALGELEYYIYDELLRSYRGEKAEQTLSERLTAFADALEKALPESALTESGTEAPAEAAEERDADTVDLTAGGSTEGWL